MDPCGVLRSSLSGERQTETKAKLLKHASLWLHNPVPYCSFRSGELARLHHQLVEAPLHNNQIAGGRTSECPKRGEMMPRRPKKIIESIPRGLKSLAQYQYAQKLSVLTLEPTASRLEVWRATIAPAELCAHFGPILSTVKYIILWVS
jgi:hypothetical protein